MFSNLLANSIYIDNREIKKIRYSALCAGYAICKPYNQRIIDESNVNDIVKYQLAHIKQHGHANFLGSINVHYVKDIEKYFLVDGQHRYDAASVLLNRHAHDIFISVEFVTVNNMFDLRDNYKIINKNTPLPEFSDDIDKSIPEQAARFFQAKYPSVWSKTSRAHRPHVFFTFFQEALGKLVEELGDRVQSSGALIDIVEHQNSLFAAWAPNGFPDVKADGFGAVLMHEKARESSFYLGMFPYTSTDEYSYLWARMIIEQHTGKKVRRVIPGGGARVKKGVPKKVKNDVWDKYIGSSIGEALCIVCQQTVINAKHFDAGHIVAESKGGTSSVDNILPVCGGCNQSMGSENMGDYIRCNYSKNYRYFEERVYIRDV